MTMTMSVCQEENLGKLWKLSLKAKVKFFNLFISQVPPTYINRNRTLEHPIAAVVTEENWWGNDVAQNASYYYDDDLDLSAIPKNSKESKAPPKQDKNKQEAPSAKTDSNKAESQKNDTQKSSEPKTNFNARVSKEAQPPSQASSTNQSSASSSIPQNYVSQSNSKESIKSVSTQQSQSSGNAYERIPGGGPPISNGNSSEITRTGSGSSSVREL